MTVYFIRATCCPAIKIGYTSGPPESRLRQLQVAHPQKLELIGYVPEADYSLESELHDKLARWRLCGEWFAPSVEVLKEIDCLLSRPTIADDNAQRIASNIEVANSLSARCDWKTCTEFGTHFVSDETGRTANYCQLHRERFEHCVDMFRRGATREEVGDWIRSKIRSDESKGGETKAAAEIEGVISNSPSSLSLREQAKALIGLERIAFVSKHKDALIAEMSKEYTSNYASNFERFFGLTI